MKGDVVLLKFTIEHGKEKISSSLAVCYLIDFLLQYWNVVCFSLLPPSFQGNCIPHTFNVQLIINYDIRESNAG